MTFSPANSGSPGNRAAALNVPGGAPASVLLTGVATQAGILLPTSFNFGSQLAGTSGTPQPLTVTNNSSGAFAGALAIASASVTADFSISSDACTSAATPPGGTCAIQIEFSPQAGASCATPNRSANLSRTDNAPGSPQSVPLSGTAMDFCFNAPGGQAIAAPIAAGQPVPPYSVQMTSSAGFTGTVGLSCVAAPTGDGVACATVPASVQVSPGMPGQFQVMATTTANATAAAAPQRKFPAPPNVRSLMLLLAFCLLLGTAGVRLMKSPRRLWLTLGRLAQACALLLSFAAGIAACGGGGGTASDPPPGTPPGNYTLTVTATTTVGSTQTTRASIFTLTVN